MNSENNRWSKDEIGKRYGKFIVLSYSHTSKWRQAYFVCVCDCGNKKTVRLSSLKSGVTLSCGCFAKEFCPTVSVKHGRSRDGSGSTYVSWMSMNNRCHCKSNREYEHYGGRGIVVCERWKGENGFSNFLSDMGERPSQKHSIDRINTNGIYEPANCRWALSGEQHRNKRTNVICTINGETMCLLDWCVRFNKPPSTVRARLKRGILLEEALK